LCSMARFNTANAREMAARSVASRQQRAAQRVTAPAPVPFPTTPQTEPDPTVARIAHVMERTLDRMDHEKEPRALQALSRALRDLRETYHLVTGQPRPGQRRPAKERTPSASYFDVQPPDLTPDYSGPR